jgi:predicted DNA-binding protein (MmcQ/YjbR family)
MSELQDTIPKDLETLVFERSMPDQTKLKEFGFQERYGSMVWSGFFHDGQFQAVVTVDEHGKVAGTVYETEMEEEYLPLRVASQTSGFVSMIRQEYYDLLIRIREECFVPMLFQSAQAMRMHEQILQTYGDPFDHPFAKDARSLVYRCPSNHKWYALVMPLQLSKLDPNLEGNGEIMNLKQPEEEIEKLICEPGIYPAWHMNHRNWISAVLDDSLSDARLSSLIAKSRKLVDGGGTAKAGNEWIVPANPKYYDLTKHFRVNHVSEWKQSVKASVGDTVYIYTAAPYSAILYKTIVEETDIPYQYRDRNLKITKLMKLRVVKKYPPELLTMKVLRTFGVRSMQGSKRLPLALKKVIDALDEIE